MKGNTQVIAALNELLSNELSAMDQYFIHARMYHDWGLSKLFERIDHEVTDEKAHAAALIERILFLEGLPNLQHLGKLYIGQHTVEVLNCDIRKVKENIEAIKQAVELAEAEQDYVTRDLVQEILEKEEEYWDWLDTQLDLVENVGIENYIQSQI